MEAARPQTTNEEDLQLQLALEMSKAEADKSKTETDKEDLRLKMAIQESLKEETEANKSPRKSQNTSSEPKDNSSGLLDLGDPWSIGNTESASKPSVQSQVQQDPFAAAPTSNDPWGLGVPTTNTVQNSSTNADPWGTSSNQVQQVQNQQN